MTDEKIGFFRRVKKAIFNFDEYIIFTNEALKKAFGYLFKLITIITIIITIATTYKTYKIAKQSIEIFKTQAPNFVITDGVLVTENDDKFKYIDDSNYFGVIIDAGIEDAKNIEYNECLAFAKDKIYLKTNNRVQVASYKDFINGNFSKNDLEALLTKSNLIKVYMFLGIAILISNFIAYAIVLLINILTLSIFGILVNWIAKTNLKYSKIFIISIYAITLPAILLMIYTIVNVLTDFTVKYFNLAFDIISYIYIITVILMMKQDLIKNKQELFVDEKPKEKIEPIIVREKKGKTKKESKGKKEKNDKKEKQKDGPGEPEGSNA